jgi:hypothetical protein
LKAKAMHVTGAEQKAATFSMSSNRRCCYPGRSSDWLPEGQLAHLISDTVDTLEGAFHARYDKDGPRNRPFTRR